MSWRPKVLQIFDVVLRVPPLFVMDSMLNQTFLVPWIPDDISIFGAAFLAWMLLIFICFAGAIMMFLLPTKQMIDTYSFLLCACMLWFSYWFNMNYVLQEMDVIKNINESIAHNASANASSEYEEQFLDIIFHNPQALFTNALVQILMAFTYNSLRVDLFNRHSLHTYNWNYSIIGLIQSLKGGTYLCLLQPVILRLLSVPMTLLKRSPLLAVMFIATELKISLIIQMRAVIMWFKRVYLTTTYVLRTYGIQAFVESQWIRLHVPSVLRVFWLTRLAYQVTYWIAFKVIHNQDNPDKLYLDLEDCLDIARIVLVSGCETFVALLGMTSVVSFITHYVGIGFASFIGSDNEEDRNMGTVSAILFFILALQTGLTGLSPEKRIVRLYRNMCLLSTAILHFVHSMVNPLLMNLSASHNLSKSKHLRALAMCLILILFPCWFLCYLWQRHTISTWLLAVTAFSVEVVIKVVITLLQYTLFMMDAYRDGFWEKLDDYIYYIKSTGNTIEFLFGIFLFGNGAWIMVFESGGTIRAVMMCIHAYFNIWVQAKEGWKVFMKRRTAVNKINSLPSASIEQIQSHNDVCAICYQELISARITRCNHYFHGVCLRKWLYVQDRCPLCHELIYQPDPSTNTDETQNNNREENQDNNANGQVVHEHHE